MLDFKKRLKDLFGCTIREIAKLATCLASRRGRRNRAQKGRRLWPPILASRDDLQVTRDRGKTVNGKMTCHAMSCTKFDHKKKRYHWHNVTGTRSLSQKDDEFSDFQIFKAEEGLEQCLKTAGIEVEFAS